SDVKILEALPAFLGAADEAVAKEAAKVFAKQNLSIELGVKITKVTVKKTVTVEYTDASGNAQSAVFDKLIVAIGRVPNTNGLGAEIVGLKLDDRGFVAVDDECRTNLPNVWAIGDVVRGPMLAHKAEEEGVAVAQRIVGQYGHVDFNTVPWVIYTSPEIAWVGQTEQQLKASGRAYKAGTFPFLANGRARALGDTTGMVKFLADAATDEILGVHMVGPMVSELISEAVVAMEFKASAEDIARICHAHPSLSEATKEAALAVDKRTLNFSSLDRSSGLRSGTGRAGFQERPRATACRRSARSLRPGVGRVQGAAFQRLQEVHQPAGDPPRGLHVRWRRPRQE